MQSYEFNLKISIASTSAGCSSLLIPDTQLAYFNSRCLQFEGTAEYFAFIVEKYIPYLPVLKRQLYALRDPNWKTTYQERGQELIKKNFTPDSQDWECFRHAALACGVSMCFLFVFLMQMEAAGFFQKIQKNSSRARNSLPQLPEKPRKFRKFSKIFRNLDQVRQVLHRKLRTQ